MILLFGVKIGCSPNLAEFQRVSIASVRQLIILTKCKKATYDRTKQYCKSDLYDTALGG